MSDGAGSSVPSASGTLTYSAWLPSIWAVPSARERSQRLVLPNLQKKHFRLGGVQS